MPMCFNETQNSEVLLFFLSNSVSSDVEITWDCFLYPTCRLTSQNPLNLCGLVFTFVDLDRTVAKRNPSITTWDVQNMENNSDKILIDWCMISFINSSSLPYS